MSRADRPRFIRGRARLALLVALGVFSVLVIAPMASADAAPPAGSTPVKIDNPQGVIDTFTPGTEPFKAADWNTTACKNAGGYDFGMYLSEFSAQAPTLIKAWWLLHNKDANFNAPNGLTALFYLMGKDFTTTPPAPTGVFCVGDLLKWDGPSRVRADWPNMSQTQVGFTIDCTQVSAPTQQRSCAAWNAWATAYRATIVHDASGTHTWPHYATSPVCYEASDGTVLTCGKDGFGTWATAVVQAAVHATTKWITETGMKQFVDFFIAGAETVSGWINLILFNIQPDLGASGFAQIYAIVAGSALGLMAVAFLVGMIAAVLPGSKTSLSATFLGLVKTFMGITFCGVITWTMVYIANEFTQRLAYVAGQKTTGGTLVDALEKANPAVAVIASILIIVSAIVLLVLMVFRVPFVYVLGVLGPMVAVGQMSPATESWQKKWFFRLLAVCWMPFFVLVVYELGVYLMVNPTTYVAGRIPGAEPEFVNSVTALSGALLLVAAAFVPKLIIEMFEFIDAGGLHGLVGAGGRATTHAGRAGAGAARTVAGGTPAVASGAAGVMAAGYRAVTRGGGGSRGGGAARPDIPNPKSAGMTGSKPGTTPTSPANPAPTAPAQTRAPGADALSSTAPPDITSPSGSRPDGTRPTTPPSPTSPAREPSPAPRATSPGREAQQSTRRNRN